MLVRLQSRNQDFGSSGKTLSAVICDYSIRTDATDDEEPTWLFIHGQTCEDLGTGERGGDIRTIEKTVWLHLDRDDLRRILLKAVADNLLKLPEKT